MLIEHGLLRPATVARCTVEVFAERDAAQPPEVLPPLPEGWPGRYERLAADIDIQVGNYADAVELVRRLWTDMFPRQQR